MKVMVLGGGNSPEREVSLRSAKAMAQACREAGYDVFEADPSEGLHILDSLSRDTIVFPILHGMGGEDGVIQAELEKRSLKFLGSDSQASADNFNKWKTLTILKKAGLPTAESDLVTKKSFQDHKLAQKPYVLKVVHGGSSIGVLIARDPLAIAQAQIDEIFQMESPAILERLIEGVEITVPILGLNALPVIEIVPPYGLEFDYENKYNGATAEICPPKSVSVAAQVKAQKLAEHAHRLAKCRHLSRIDMMIKVDGDMVIFDINTIPGLTDQSLYPKSADEAGLPMPKLVQKFAEMVIRDYNL